ncbi:hypothetical protein FCOIX_5560 [Fusarium coicis]|nr:hypothetical protein FCOIX_5560 [Fusarium coicis]
MSSPELVKPAKRKYIRSQDGQKDKLLSDLTKASTGAYWRDYVATKHHLAVKTLTALWNLVQFATSRDIDPEILLIPGEYGVLGPTSVRNLSAQTFSDALECLENKVRKKSQNESITNDEDANSGTVIKAASGMDAESSTLYDEARNFNAPSIKTKIANGGAEEARVQLGVWVAAWHQRIRMLMGPKQAIVTLPLILVLEHKWQLLFACYRGSHIDIVESVDIGDTKGLMERIRNLV